MSTAQGVRFQATLASATGVAIASAGDVNGDGIGDLLIGSPGDHRTYVVYGQAGGFTETVDLSALTASQGFLIQGAAGTGAGRAVAAVGDTNGNGIGDLLIGASGASAAYLLYGPGATPVGTVSLAALLPSQGFRMDGALPGDQTGLAVAAAGDVNGDGLADMIIGAPDSSNAAGGNGSAYVIYGQAGTRSGPVALAWLAEAEGFRILGGAPGGGAIGEGDRAGTSVSAAGDVNGDGFGDVLVGAPGIKQATIGIPAAVGGAFIVYGPNQPITWSGGAGADTKLGGSFGDVLNGAAGNDSIDGKAGQDSLLGGADNDSLAGGEGADLLDGNDGNDGNDSLDGGAGADTMIGGAGNDTYVVDDAGDVLLEDAVGLAKVLSSVTWTLAANFFDLTLIGTAGIDGTGNARDNWITGNGSANGLAGGGGNDLLEGGDGKDKLAGGNGDDLLLGGAGKDNLSGGSGNDILDGGGDADKLTGGSGADRFVFAVATAVKQANTITDFSAAQGDRVEILRTAFEANLAG